MTFYNIQNGQPHDADKVRENDLAIAKTLAKDSNIRNIAFTSDVADTKTNFSYDANTDEYISTSSSATLEVSPNISTPPLTPFATIIGGFEAIPFTVYDETDDSSVDSTLWQSSYSMTENTDYLEVEEVNMPGSEVDFLKTHPDEDFSNYQSMHMFIERTLSRSGSGVTSTTSRYGSDLYIEGSSAGKVKIWQDPANKNLYGTDQYRLDVLISGTDALVFQNGSFDGVVDISAVSGTWQLTFGMEQRSQDTARLRVYFLRVVSGSESTTLTTSFSFDNGDSYVEADDGYARASESSYLSRAKLEATISSGEGVFVAGADYLEVQ